MRRREPDQAPPCTRLLEIAFLVHRQRLADGFRGLPSSVVAESANNEKASTIEQARPHIVCGPELQFCGQYWQDINLRTKCQTGRGRPPDGSKAAAFPEGTRRCAYCEPAKLRRGDQPSNRSFHPRN